MSAATWGIENISARVLDAYDRPARLYPGLIALSPMAVMILCVYGQQRILISSVITVAATCGCAYALARIVRNAGQQLQASLFSAWGGPPTVQLLRHSNGHFDAHTKERFHKILSKGLGKKMPTVAGEANDSFAADELYRAATVWLIGKTRDAKKFPLVFKENIAFGFQRNVLGIRRFGIAISLGCLLYCSAYIAIQSAWGLVELLKKTPTPIWVSLLYSIFILLAWLFCFREPALRKTAFSYAERLIQSLDMISMPKGRITKDS